MAKFFVPYADSIEQAERVYGAFVKNHGYQVDSASGRLFKLTYWYHRQFLDVEVGKEISGFPEPVGAVLGIVESSELLTIHMHLRGGLSATPILVAPDDARDRVYFDFH